MFQLREEFPAFGEQSATAGDEVTYLAEGERRLAEQEARVAEFERKGRDVEQSKKLLMVMRDTMTLQTDHVRLLEREVREARL
jgi:hypothetical protein